VNTPTSVKVSASAWFAAVAAGAIESVLAVSEIAGEGELDAGAWLSLGFRVVVYVVAIVMITRLLRGSRAARIGLTVLLSVIGLASLVVPAALALADGQTMLEAFGSGGPLEGAFFVVRMAHILLVILATAAMFSPTASAYLASTNRGGKSRETTSISSGV
jgi:hypothetical protein